MLRHIQLGQHRLIEGVYFVMSLFSLCLATVFYYLDGVAAIAFYLFLIPPIIYFIVIPLRIKFQANALFKNKDVFHHPISYEFSEKGVFTENARGSEDISWDRVVKVMETGYEFIFYLDRTKAFTIPKRLFDPVSERAFEDYLCKHYDPNKLFRN
ncbi:MAG: YcxB family protein [bacterium]|nr:YcxB family protein [bacterium]